MLQIKNIYKEYKTGNLIQKALDNVSLNLRDNEFVAILGPSGSGKTTFLNIIGGLDCYDDGDLIINNISTKAYKDRDWDSYRNHTIGFVFQSYNLIPHQTILVNVELALTISGVSRRERKQKALEALKQVGLEKQAHKKPNQLSGGQMQRVAIARALVNNPDILLADEPTGALDSETSIQVMELLKDVARDRLVVMVTHNPELAEKYANRIVKLKDGVICSDTNPYDVDKKDQEIEHKNMGKTSMSFLTSLALSFNNLRTKKGRTFLTSFAGSIGIIGIAMILSLSNGVNSYIKSVEEDTLSEYPLQIQKTGFDMTSMLVSTNSDIEKEENNNDIQVINSLSNMFSSIGTNDLSSLKKYFESEECNIKEYSKAIEYKYDITPKIYSSDVQNLRQLNPNNAFSSLGISSESSSNSLMSSMMSADVFYQMPKDTSLFESQYDIKIGTWPKKYNECVLVLTSNGNINDFLLYTLGLRDYKELDNMVEQFSKNEEVNVQKYDDSYTYEDILNITFKLINNSDCYQYDEEYNVWRDKTDNDDYMKELVNNGEELKIVGIIQPKEGVTAAMLQNGIYYPSSLIEHLIKNAEESEIVKKQINSPEINVFSGKSFDDNSENNQENAFNMNSLIDVDESKMKSAFKFDQSKIKVDFSNLNKLMNNANIPEFDMSKILNEIDFKISSKDIQILMNKIIEGYSKYIKEKSGKNVNQITKQLEEYLKSKEASELLKKKIEEIIKNNKDISITQEQMKQVLISVLQDYKKYTEKNDLLDNAMIEKYLIEYLKSEQAKKIITDYLTEIIKNQKLDKQISVIMEKYMESMMSQISKSMEKEIKKSITQLSKSMTKALSIDTNAFVSAINIKMGEEELLELFTSLMSKEKYSYEGNLKKLNYAQLEEPSGIDIYPKNFEGNKSIIGILDEYNSRMENENQEEKVISYTDMVGTLMSSVTLIVDVISYVLVAFVAISLVVSSIMIGVITYISVLERKKEIGILRAIGASKRNISQVFNAETFIIGLLSGFIGIGSTMLLLIPTNKIIHAIANGVSVTASLPMAAATILVILSTVLTLIGGIIPSKKAAKEDPVLALRSE